MADKTGMTYRFPKRTKFGYGDQVKWKDGRMTNQGIVIMVTVKPPYRYLINVGVRPNQFIRPEGKLSLVTRNFRR